MIGCRMKRPDWSFDLKAFASIVGVSLVITVLGR